MSTAAPAAPTDHFTIISSDCHAGGSHAAYREYLDRLKGGTELAPGGRG